jgi:hypothetical protein
VWAIIRQAIAAEVSRSWDVDGVLSVLALC